MVRRRLGAGRSTEEPYVGRPFDASAVRRLLLVGQLEVALPAGVGVSNASDGDSEERTGLTEMLDESLQTKREDHQAWHDMGFMTPDHVPPTTSQDWESTP